MPFWTWATPFLPLQWEIEKGVAYETVLTVHWLQSCQKTGAHWLPTTTGESCCTQRGSDIGV